MDIANRSALVAASRVAWAPHGGSEVRRRQQKGREMLPAYRAVLIGKTGERPHLSLSNASKSAARRSPRSLTPTLRARTIP